MGFRQTGNPKAMLGTRIHTVRRGADYLIAYASAHVNRLGEVRLTGAVETPHAYFTSPEFTSVEARALWLREVIGRHL